MHHIFAVALVLEIKDVFQSVMLPFIGSGPNTFHYWLENQVTYFFWNTDVLERPPHLFLGNKEKRWQVPVLEEEEETEKTLKVDDDGRKKKWNKNFPQQQHQHTTQKPNNIISIIIISTHTHTHTHTHNPKEKTTSSRAGRPLNDDVVVDVDRPHSSTRLSTQQQQKKDTGKILLCVCVCVSSRRYRRHRPQSGRKKNETTIFVFK